MFFDSHCHLSSPPLAEQFDALLDRALESGVTGFLNIGDDLDASRRALDDTRRAQARGIAMWAAAGVHPQKAASYVLDDGGTGRELRELWAQPEVKAVGEIGLDWVYDETHPHHPGATRQVQEQVLRDQLGLARELQMPVVLHNREADDDLLRVVSASGVTRGVFHCFGSSLDVARRALDLGFHLGFGGIVTFKNAPLVREAARFCPLDRLLLETDAPYLAPIPHRGKTNEPSFLPHTAQFIAQERRLPLEELASATTHNAHALLGV